MLENRNPLDDIAEELQHLSSRVACQASKRRMLEKSLSKFNSVEEEMKKFTQGFSYKAPKQCYREFPEEDENPYHNDGQEGFCDRDLCESDQLRMMRNIGRIEGRLMKLMDNELLQCSEDYIQQYTHEQIFEKAQNICEELQEIIQEVDSL